jgi:hypothetical protein
MDLTILIKYELEILNSFDKVVDKKVAENKSH